jgi:hypothetical protein
MTDLFPRYGSEAKPERGSLCCPSRLRSAIAEQFGDGLRTRVDILGTSIGSKDHRNGPWICDRDDKCCTKMWLGSLMCLRNPPEKTAPCGKARQEISEQDPDVIEMNAKAACCARELFQETWLGHLTVASDPDFGSGGHMF